MNEQWPWYVGGLALASIALVHWLVLRRSLAVSGRFTSIVNRMRFGPPEDLSAMSEADLLAAVREASEAAFGPQNLEASAPPQAAPEAKEPALVRPSLSTTDHLVFLGSMAVGGLLSAVFSHGFHPSFALQGVTFAHIFGTNPIAIASVLLASGLLVGFGTRMAGGCTSGHGLCGVSRFQVGSVLATCAFFGTAVAVSLAMTVIR